MKEQLTFEVWEWDKWVRKIVDQFKTELNGQCTPTDINLMITDLLKAPALDPENLLPFCTHFMFEDIYQDRIFVSHHTDPNSYWFINGDHTCLIYNPRMIKNRNTIIT